jgi:hypothetical protein
MSIDSEAIKRKLEQILNENGYSFQYTLLKAIKDLHDKRLTPWSFEVAEFPVAINGTPVHIDFILKNTKSAEPFFLIAECKRANPALSNWCFVKVPYVSKGRDYGGVERIVREAVGNLGGTFLHASEATDDIYHLGFEVKSDQKGEGNLHKGQINEAVTQVLRGLNGLIQYHLDKLKRRNPSSPAERYSTSFVPVIFTTADLWVSDVAIRDADLSTGNKNISDSQLTKREWLFFHYAVSPNLKHESHFLSDHDDLSDVLYFKYTRTIAIVNPSGLESFLSNNLWGEYTRWDINK